MIIREKVRSEYVSINWFGERFVEIIVDFFRKSLSLTQRNNCELVKVLVSSVPKSSIINKSQSKILLLFEIASESREKTPLDKVSKS